MVFVWLPLKLYFSYYVLSPLGNVDILPLTYNLILHLKPVNSGIGMIWCWEGLGQEEKGTTEDEMAGWHHWFDGRESEWTPGDGDGQGGLACCDSWGHKESDTTEQLNWTELNISLFLFIYFKLKDNCFTILFPFLPYINENFLSDSENSIRGSVIT